MSETISRIFAIVGIAGSILCALGDYFLYRCNGTDSVRIGNDKKIESNWDKADLNDFVRSGILASFSIPMYYLGIVAFSWCLYLQISAVGIAYYIVLTIGAMGGVGFHLNACFMPLLYKTITERGGSIELVKAPKILCLLTPLSLLILGLLLAKVNKVFKTFPLALTNTIGLGGIAIIALFCM